MNIAPPPKIKFTSEERYELISKTGVYLTEEEEKGLPEIHRSFLLIVNVELYRGNTKIESIHGRVKSVRDGKFLTPVGSSIKPVSRCFLEPTNWQK